MKRLKLTLASVALTILIAVSAWGLIYPTIKQAITTADYVAVRLPSGSSCTTFSLWTEDGSAYYISSKLDGSDGILVTSDGTKNFPFSMNQVLGGKSEGTILCYVKGTTSTNLVGLVIK